MVIKVMKMTSLMLRHVKPKQNVFQEATRFAFQKIAPKQEGHEMQTLHLGKPGSVCNS